MIQLKISGRAGNQLFQYATVYSYMKENNIDDDLYISFEELERKKTDTKTFCDTLKFFNVQQYKTINKIKMTMLQKILDFGYKVNIKLIRIFRKIIRSSMQSRDYEFIDRIWHKILNYNGLYYYMPTNRKFYKSKKNNIIFYGSFESEKFFEKYKDDIYNMFTPIQGEMFENEKLYEIIKNTNSVCVTIRRGDFLLEKFRKQFYICTPEYFEKAIDEIDKRVEEPQFVVFSDDVDWCKKNMKFPKETVFESGNDPIWEKIRLMYSCKNFIISNSTFSWWAQFLSRNQKKVVIAPKEWNRFEFVNPIYNSEWYLI